MTREEAIADAIKKVHEEYDRKEKTDSIEKHFKERIGYPVKCLPSIGSKWCTRISLELPIEQNNMDTILQIAKNLAPSKSYTQKTSTTATDCLSPHSEKDIAYDIQIRVNSNSYNSGKNITASFIVWDDTLKDYYAIVIRANSDLLRVQGYREEYIGGYRIKNCSLDTLKGGWSKWEDNKVTEVGRITWNGEGTFLQEISLFVNII